MTSRPRPMLGLLLGMFLGAIGVGLLWQLGVIDPGRTVAFVTLAVATLAVSGLLTRQVSAARGRFVTVAVIAGVFAGVGVTGVPELISVGRVSDGCSLEVTTAGTTATPAETTALTPLDVEPDAVVEWALAAAEPIAVDRRVGGMLVGGFAVPVRTVTSDPMPEAAEVSGTVDVASGLESVRERTGLELTGVYHIYGEVAGDGGSCTADGWVRIAPAGLFATNVLVGLWIALGVALLLIAWAALAVRRSFVQAHRAAIDAGRVHSGTVTTGAGGSLAGGAAAGYVAPDVDPSGVTAPGAVTDPVPVDPAPDFSPSARASEEPAATIAPAPATPSGAAARGGSDAPGPASSRSGASAGAASSGSSPDTPIAATAPASPPEAVEGWQEEPEEVAVLDEAAGEPGAEAAVETDPDHEVPSDADADPEDDSLETDHDPDEEQDAGR